MKQQAKNTTSIILFAILLSYFTYFYVMQQQTYYLADFHGHTHVYLPMFTKETWVQGWMTVPYCMWHLTTLFLHHILHIPVEASAAYATCFYSLFAYFVLYWMIQKVMAAAGCKDFPPSRAALTAFGLCFVQPLYFYWLDLADRFLGSYSMNPLHNPTQMCVRGFSLLCICLVYDIWNKQKDKNYCGVFFQVKNGLKKYYICLSVTLFLSAMAKPTFAEMFIPAVAFVMLGEWIARIVRKDNSAKDYFHKCLLMLLCAVPTLLYILLQFLAYFVWGGSYGADGTFIVTKWLEVWHMYSNNVLLSVLLGMAFPLFMVLINTQFYLKDDLGRLALTGYGVGFLEAALFGESGGKLSHSDFLWPMMSGMLLMWVVSTLKLLVLEYTQADTKGKRILINTAWFLFFVHVCYGLMYVKETLDKL